MIGVMTLMNDQVTYPVYSYRIIRRKEIRDDTFGSKVGQIGPNWDKSRAFSDHISVDLAPHF